MFKNSTLYPLTRTRWRQTPEVSRGLTLTAAQFKVVEMYYSDNARIVQASRFALGEKICHVQLGQNASICPTLGMCMVDSRLLYKGAVGRKSVMKQNVFFRNLER